MYKHHEDSIHNFIKWYQENSNVIAVILGGSIAKGKERIDSDIDLMVIVNDEMHKELSSKNKLSETITEHCTYENGYFDIKYFTKDYLLKASKVGSEPTRNAFIGASCLFSNDPEIIEIIHQIPVYPVWEKEEKILSFFSALMLNSYYFWEQAVKTNDLFLKTRAATDIVLFGSRMLLAYNEKLFPCQKWLMTAVNELDNKPANITDKANLFLQKLDDETKNDFVSSILAYCEWNVPQDYNVILSRFVEDNELWWYNHRPILAEW
ncbi:nucleotidyltransferase domain-containing protein [Paenibacillus sanguinis]|uniref:nucleotidyltransferase domain-containing protein n=1 Tax=Paenibacillus sanguinis TaxID=225906 RepID=UPI000362B19D|nr:nucleotidyltransferase domain-containing protein [Paenibacillus sanguinis]